MGRRIAFACVTGGVETRLYDVSAKAAEEAVRTVRRLVEEGGATVEAAMSKLDVCATLASCVTGVDLAIETVSESVGLKRKVFAEIDRAAAPHVLIGTNTSSILGSRLADATGRPEKVFNFNWGHASHRKVELMPHPGTAPATMESAVAFIRSLGLIPTRDRKEILGYGSNRIWRAVKKEVLHVIGAGVLTPEDIDRAWMLDWHVPMGPCGLMDQIGLDVVRDIELVYYQASGDPSDRPPTFLEEMIRSGRLGEKTGEGFYRYPDPAYARPDFLEGRDGAVSSEQ